jgi:RNA recognition motif-containing protein
MTSHQDYQNYGFNFGMMNTLRMPMTTVSMLPRNNNHQLTMPPPSFIPYPDINNNNNNNSGGGGRTKLFVGNLASDATLAELIELFGKYGKVNEKLCVVKDENYAFIHFYSEKDAEDACKNLNDSFFKNRYIRVQYSTSQGHIKKPIHPSTATHAHKFEMSRSSSAMFFSENMARQAPFRSVSSTSREFGLNDAQLKTNLLIPASFLQSITNLSINDNGEGDHPMRYHSFKTNQLTSSQSVQSFGSTFGGIGSGRPILKSKYV